LGFEIDSSKAQRLLRGESYIEDVADSEIGEALKAGFRPTVDASELAEAEAYVICVPTPLKDQMPDLSAVIEAGTAVGDHLSGGELVILQSTSYPGTTQDELQPLLEQRSRLRAGEGFYLAYAPERIDPSNPPGDCAIHRNW
jgi:UDP-N-acetyl-D-glucosamine dehydrogenase